MVGRWGVASVLELSCQYVTFASLVAEARR
jgi:hypothetical protein